MNNLQRKKRAFMSIITRPLGFVRTVSGVSPLSLPYAMKGKADNYVIEGKSVQDGTPSPENPIEIKSVGEKTVNRVDYTKIQGVTNCGITYTNNNDGSFTANGTLTFATSTLTLASGVDMSSFIVGETYYASCGNDFYEDNRHYYMFIFIRNSETNAIRYYSTRTAKDKVFTLAENEYVSGVEIRIHSANGELYECSNIVFTPMICKASEYNGYEPYGKYKLNVVNRGVNLFDYKTLTSRNQSQFPLIINDDGSIEYNGTYYIQADISHLESGKTYVASMEYLIDGMVSDYRPTCAIYYDDGTYINSYYGAIIQTDATKKISKIYWYFRKLDTTVFQVKAWNFQIQEGSTATDYEPYREPITTPIFLDEPLRGIGDYKDKIDFENGMLERKIISKSFDGTEAWVVGGSSFVACSWNGILSSTSTLCTYLPNANMVSGTTDEVLYARAVTNVLRIVKQNGTYTDVGEWKSLLAQWSESEMSFTVVTQLSTPKTESITPPELPLFEGTNILSIDGDIQPEMTVIYKSSVKEV